MATTKEKIEIVLNEEKRAYAAKGRSVGGLGGFNHEAPNHSAVSGTPRQEWRGLQRLPAKQTNATRILSESETPCLMPIGQQ